MSLKKLVVGCLAISLLIGSGGSVMAYSEQGVTDVGTTEVVVSEVGKPVKIVGDTVFKIDVGNVTGDDVLNYLKTLKVVDADGNDLGMSDKIKPLDAKSKPQLLDQVVSYLNNKTISVENKGLLVGLEDYYGVSCDISVQADDTKDSKTIVIDSSKYHFPYGHIVTSADILAGITVKDGSGNTLPDELSNIRFSSGQPILHQTVDEEVALINQLTAQHGYDFWNDGGMYMGVFLESSTVTIKDIVKTRVYFDGTPTVDGNIVYTTHVENIGWQDKVKDGKMAGTEGKSLRLEGIKIESGIPGVGVEYATHVQNIGWQDFVADGKMSGTEGKSLRLEAIKIRLTGENADKYDVYYRVHTQNIGWMGWASNGASAGTAGFSYRLEGIEIKIVEKGTFTGDTTNTFRDAVAENKWKQLYSDKLKSIQEENSSLKYTYALDDMNADGSMEMIVKTTKPDEGMGVCNVYKLTDDKSAVQKLECAEMVQDGVGYTGGYRSFISIPNDGNGLYVMSFFSTKPEIDVNRLTISGDKVVVSDVTTFLMKSDEQKAFNEANHSIQWFDIGNMQGLV